MNIKDPLDIKGINNNFLNDQKYSNEYIKFAEKWSEFPVYSDKNKLKKFINLLENNQVILVVSGTGSGKTVIIPKLILKYMNYNKIDGITAVTNPKILTTLSNAEYGALTLDVKLGEEVGYKYQGNNNTGEKTKLLYCTDGTIRSILTNKDELLSDYNCVIIDEAHERQINIDLLLLLLKQVVKKRKDFKLIIMSATINTEIFQKYYDEEGIKFGQIEFSGTSNYNIEQKFIKDGKINRANYIEKSVDIIFEEIINKNKDGDIIVFGATEPDIKKGCLLLKKNCNNIVKNKKICDETYCVEVYSKMNKDNKELAIDKDKYKQQKNKVFERKIIFATNVAESSLTFDGLKFVIEPGYELIKKYDALTNSTIINKDFTTQAQIKQRIGRVGRTSDGVAYHLYEENKFKKLEKYPLPSILKDDITINILELFKKYKCKQIMELLNNMIQKPKDEQIYTSLNILNYNNIIKIRNELNIKDIYNNDGDITKLGRKLLKIKNMSNINNMLMIILGIKNKCINDVINIIAIIENCEYDINKYFDKDDDNYDDNYFKKYIIKNSDHLTILNIYKSLYLVKNHKLLNVKMWNKLEDKIKDIKNNITGLKINYEEYEIQDLNNLLKSIILESYRYNKITYSKKDKEYKTINNLKNINSKINKMLFMEYDKKDGIYTKIINSFGRTSYYCITIE